MLNNRACFIICFVDWLSFSIELDCHPCVFNNVVHWFVLVIVWWNASSWRGIILDVHVAITIVFTDCIIAWFGPFTVWNFFFYDFHLFTNFLKFRFDIGFFWVDIQRNTFLRRFELRSFSRFDLFLFFLFYLVLYFLILVCSFSVEHIFILSLFFFPCVFLFIFFLYKWIFSERVFLFLWHVFVLTSLRNLLTQNVSDLLWIF